MSGEESGATAIRRQSMAPTSGAHKAETSQQYGEPGQRFPGPWAGAPLKHYALLYYAPSLGGKTTFHLSRDLKDEITRHACYAWWRHCFGGKIGYAKDRKDPEIERAKEIACKMKDPAGTVQ